MQTALDLECWNTVGIPYEVNYSSRDTEDDGNHMVRKAVRDIESGIYSSQFYDRRRDTVEKIDISQTKRYWKEKEKESYGYDVKAPVDFRTDYPLEGERDESVIVIKVDESDGVDLKPNETVILSPLKTRLKLGNGNSRTVTDKNIFDGQKKTFDYEKNWHRPEKNSWYSGFPDPAMHYKKEVLDRTRNSEKHSYQTEPEMIKTDIPYNVKIGRVCSFCKKVVHSAKCSKHGTFKYRTLEYANKGKFDRMSNGYRTLTSKKEDNNYSLEKNHDCKDWFSINSQRSRTNFFGNSGSYALRCNLNPISKFSSRKKRFYLSPEMTLEHSRKMKEPYFESFTAAKKEFKKSKVNLSDLNRSQSQKKSDAVIW